MVPRVNAPETEFSLCHDPVLRLQRALRLVPGENFAGARRAIVMAIACWAPIMTWAAFTGHLDPHVQDESIMRHLGVHVRCLLGIPLLILSEPIADRVMRILTAYFPSSGLIRDEDRPAYSAVVRSVERLRDSALALAIILGTVVLSVIFARREWLTEDADALIWTLNGGALDFGGWWALYIVRPLFLFLLLTWVWRLLLTWILFRRISRLNLQLVPSHPDRVGGLGVMRLHSVAFSLVVLAISSVACAAVAHQLLAHGGTVAQVQPLLIFLVAFLLVLFVLPLTAFSPQLRRTSIRAQFEYGTLSGRHVRGLHERWINGKKLEDDILSAPEIGPAADVATLYTMATKMQMVPFGKNQLLAIVVPAALPALLVISLEVPLGELILKLLQMLS
jgi:hypothetical protein